MPIATPEQYVEMIERAKAGGYALPAINVTSLETLNAAIEGFARAGSDGIIQFSTGGAKHASGSAKDNVLGAIVLAEAAHRLAAKHHVMIALHTDHCTPEEAPKFLDPLIDESERRVRNGQPPLFSSHMLDASNLPMKENLELSQQYLRRCAKNGIVLEMEIGVVGGQEEGAAGEHGAHAGKLYTTPADMLATYEALEAVKKEMGGKAHYMVAATFGNVHGMYKPGNVKLDPKILEDGQKAIEDKYGIKNAMPLVFHGGSGTPIEEIHATLGSGVVKMNVDTQTQADFAKGIYDYVSGTESKYPGAFTGEIMDKKKVDPREITKPAMAKMAARVEEVSQNLKSAGKSLYAEFAARSSAKPTLGKWTGEEQDSGQKAVVGM